MSTKSVQIPDVKKSRYLLKLHSWTEGQKFSRKDAESILGTLVHCSLAIPDGRSRLPALYRFVSSFNNSASPFIRRSPNPSVLSDIDWWRHTLSVNFCGSFLAKPPLPSPIQFWVDASSSWGIGIIFEHEWDAWMLHPGWDKGSRDIGWAEIVAIELGLLFAVHRGFSDIHFIINSDNQGVIHAIEGGKSRNSEQNLVLQRITALMACQSLWISSRYVPSADSLADLPSRGIPPPLFSRTDTTFLLPTSLLPFLIRASVIT